MRWSILMRGCWETHATFVWLTVKRTPAVCFPDRKREGGIESPFRDQPSNYPHRLLDCNYSSTDCYRCCGCCSQLTQFPHHSVSRRLIFCNYQFKVYNKYRCTVQCAGFFTLFFSRRKLFMRNMNPIPSSRCQEGGEKNVHQDSSQRTPSLVSIILPLNLKQQKWKLE